MTKKISLKFIVFTLLITFVMVKLTATEDYSSSIFEIETEPISPIGEWLFDNPDKPLKATIGTDLKLVGSHKVAEGPIATDKAVTIGKGSHYIVNHNIDPKEGESYVNEYSLLYDFKIDDIGKWRSFYQTNLANDSDADLFIKNSDGSIGVGHIGYSSKTVTPGQWHRLIVSVHNGVEYSLYLDGEKILSGTTQGVDGRYGLRPSFLLFADESGDDDEINIARVAVYDKALTEADVEVIGFIKVREKPLHPVGQWLFNNADNPLKATVGADLKLAGNHQLADGPMPDNGAVTIGAGSHYKINHGIEPKVGESYVNEYTVLYDFKVKNYDEWVALLQTNSENSDDANLFIRKDKGTIGVMETGYSEKKVIPGEWHRLIVSVDNGTEYSLYLDSEKILTGNVQEIDGAYALHSNLLLFADDSGDDSDIDVARVDLYDVSLKPEEVTALGKVEIPYNPFLTNPYLQNVTKEGITIMWETDDKEPGKVHFGKDENLKNEVIASSIKTNANTYINKTIINGLKPGAKYSYFVAQAESESKKMHFTTDPKGKKEDFTAAIWGDSHYPNPWSKMVEYMITEIQPDFALTTGDISNSGNRRPDLNTVFLPHVCEGIGSHIPFYSALGNHDVGGRWGGGDLIRQYHDQPKEVNSDPDGFSGSYLKMYSNVAFIFIDWNRMETDLVENGWLEQTLQSKAVKNARFRFVLVHAPPFVERWQNGEEPSVKENLPRMAEAYKVNAVFSGHMHGHERGIKNGVHYLTSGGGSYLDHGEKVGPVIYDHIIRGTNKEGNPAGLEDGLKNHFVELNIKKNRAELKIHYFNSDGSYIGIIESIPLGKGSK